MSNQIKEANKALWNKDTVTKILDFWNDSALTREEVAAKVGITVQQLQYAVNIMRKQYGFDMISRRSKGVVFSVLEEIAKERGVTLKK